MKIPPPTLLHCMAVISAVTGAGAAEQINFLSTPGSTNYTSAGAPQTLDADFVFELGAFADGFVPSVANTGDWADHWVTLGRASYNPAVGWFTARTFLDSNAAPFRQGDPAYIWGHDDGGEWILMGNPGWQWPAVSGGVGTPGGTSFSVSSPGTVAVLGAVAGQGFQMMTAAALGAVPDVGAGPWLAQHFTPAELDDPAVSGWGADPDGDGSTNLEEFAAGTRPKDPASQRRATLRIAALNGERFAEAELERSARAITDHRLGTSSDLRVWDLSGGAVTVVEDSSTRLLLRASDPVGADDRTFYQLYFGEP